MRALSLLQTAVSDGRLDLSEFDRRSAIAVEAGLDGPLRALEGVPPAQVTRSQRRNSVPSRSGYVTALRIEWSAWIGVSLINLTTWLIIALTVTPVYFWPVWVIGPWGMVLGVREVVEFVRRKRSWCQGSIR
ncbi:MAG: DUF1707 SHOCT-like domain-containing protein [Brevibacterium linens]|uniref:DUF1707 SHOCT-like domain-containing protein n=1 Tax=Brevibacterium linens TaxID=1703 RepID=UPI003F9B788E